METHSTSAMKHNCTHCGLECPPDCPTLPDEGGNEKRFCCDGCLTVYEILTANQLGNYYNIEQTPGIKTGGKPKKYDHLDAEAVQRQLHEFENEKQRKITFSIPQMHCASCIWLLENLHKLHKDILHAKTNFLRKELYVSYNHNNLKLSQLVELLASIGYEPNINLDSLNTSGKGRLTNKTPYYKIGIAGFCLGNIMLLSFPEYLGLDKALEPELHRFFGYLNLLLILPVVFYCASDYYKSTFNGLRQAALNIDVPVSLGVFALFARSVYEIISQTGAGYLDSLAGLIFFLLIGRWFQHKTYDALSFERDYTSYFPLAAVKLSNDNGNETETGIPITDLAKGDRILVRHNELVPADAVLLKGNALIDYAFVTGESAPVSAVVGETVYAGGRQVGQSIELNLLREVSQSYLTRLWNADAFAQKSEQVSLSAIADHASRYFTPVILLIALFAGLWWWQAVGMGAAANVFTAVLIVACPCALALAAPFTLGNALRIIGKKGFYLKNTGIIERLARVSHIVFDKTGTLSLPDVQRVHFAGQTLSQKQQAHIKSLVRHSTHPLSRLVWQALPHAPIVPIDDFEEIPGKGIKGAVEKSRYTIGAAAFVSGTQKTTANSLQSPDVGKAGESRVYVTENGKLLGYFGIGSRYRKGLEQLTRQLKIKYSLSVISGDGDGERNILTKLMGNEVPMLFRQQPADKMRYVAELKKKGETTLMVGDGLNDAGALKQADVGASISENINDFSPACDLIVEANAMHLLGGLLAYSKRSVTLVRIAFIISLFYNLIGLGFAVQGLLSPLVAAILMPLSSITVVAWGILSTTFFWREV